jgi:hypothetical protein
LEVLMGTDIHGVFQRRTSVGWEDVPSLFQRNRHYQLFAVLAGVRNGRGFAGIRTGDPVVPISQPRGLPADFALIDDDLDDPRHPMTKPAWDADPHSKYYEPGEDGYGEMWMGDHSHSWLTADEILRWAETAPVVEKIGVISREQFATWKRGESPGEYSGGVSGPGVVVVEQTEAEAGADGSHVRVRWHESLRKHLGYFFDEVARLRSQYGEVRFVFGFDS